MTTPVLQQIADVLSRHQISTYLQEELYPKQLKTQLREYTFIQIPDDSHRRPSADPRN